MGFLREAGPADAANAGSNQFAKGRQTPRYKGSNRTSYGRQGRSLDHLPSPAQRAHRTTQVSSGLRGWGRGRFFAGWIFGSYPRMIIRFSIQGIVSLRGNV